MSAPESAGTLAAQSGGTPSPQRRQQLEGSLTHTPPLMRVTAQEARKPEGDDETLAPAHPISRAGPEVSEDEGEGGSGSSGKKKKQRSMAELIKGLDLNLGDDGGMGEEGIEEAAPSKGEEEAATTPTTAAEEVADPPSPTSAAARKRKKDGEGDSESEAKGSPASPPTADPEANQAPVLPDGGVSSGRRERKKSKYLSPPYTMVIEKKPSFSSRSASGDALDLDGLGGVSSPLAKCSSFGRKKEAVDLELPFVFDESTPSVAELLAELRCASVGVMYLVASRHGSAVQGCFTLFRTYSYTGTGITGGNKVPVEETKPPVPAPILPIAADNKALQQRDNGGDTNNLIKTPVSTAENKNPEEANKSASGKRNYNKRKSAPAVVATTTETNGGDEELKPRGRPKKKNKEKEEKSSSLDNDGYGASTPTPPSAPAPAASNNTPAAAPFPAPAPSNNTPAAAPAPPAPSNNTLAATPAPAPALNNNTPAAAPAPSNDIPAAAPAPVVTQLQANGGSSAAVVPEQEEAKKKKKKRKRRSAPPGSASLILTFAPGADLPTKDHLLGFFSRYGVLDEARTEVRAATRVACVAYAVKADAQRAIASPDRDQTFGPGVATFRIKYARQARQPGGGEGGPVSPAAVVVMPTRAIPRLPLEFVKKNLESMIAALELCRPEGAATGSEVETDPRNELVDQMSNLLTKVNKLLADGSTSGSLSNGGVDATAAAASSTTAAAGGLTA